MIETGSIDIFQIKHGVTPVHGPHGGVPEVPHPGGRLVSILDGHSNNCSFHRYVYNFDKHLQYMCTGHYNPFFMGT